MNTLLTLHDPATARRYYADGIWQDQTFYSLVHDHAQARPDAWALRDARRRLTWSELLAYVDAFAQDLHDAGVRPGERVSVWLPNCLESVVVLLACARGGYVCNPSLHQNYTVEQTVTLLKRLDTRALITQPGYGADANTVDIFEQAKTLPGLSKIYSVTRAAKAAATGTARNAWSDCLDRNLKTTAARRDDPDRIMYLAFTSGTTGEPKGVLHSANTLLTNTRAMVVDWSHNENTVLLSLSPMSHHIGVVAVGQALNAGCELVVNDVPDGLSTLEWIESTRATYCMGVPTHAIDVQAQMAEANQARLGTVDIFYMAGAPIPPATARRFLDSGVTPQNIYGMTENSSHQYTLPTDDVDTIVGTCGRACHGFEVAIFDAENRNELAKSGDVGEIGSRGGCLMLGYFDNQSATEQSFNADGWFMSGDLGRLDQNGCLEISGRIKDLIIRGGHNIHPANIEALVLRHDAVNKAAVVAVADERLGEKACLLIICNDGRDVEGEEILAHLHSVGLSKYDMPEYFLNVAEFPLTASGKILKRELAAMIEREQYQPQPVRWIAPPPD